MLENFLSGVGRALITVELNTERAIPHPCAWCQQCRPATPEALAATAYHDHTVKFLGAVYVSRETLRGYTKPRETV